MHVEYTTWERWGNEIIQMGAQGESYTQSIWIDVSNILSMYPEAVFAIRVENPDGAVYNAVEASMDGDYLQWVFTDADTAVEGKGYAQIVAYGSVDGPQVAKTPKARTIISDGIDAPEKPPDPMREWLDEAQKTLEALKQMGGVVADGIEAVRLKTPRAIALGGEAAGETMFDGGEDVTIYTSIERLTNEELEELLK